MLPTQQKPQPSYHTLEDIRQRKDELLDQIQDDSKQFSTIWNDLFAKNEEASKGDYIAKVITNSVTIIDLFLMYRKLKKNYGSLLGLFGKAKQKH